MRVFIARIFITSLGLWLADSLLARMSFDDWQAMVLSALLLGLVNAFVRPIVVLLTLPITFLTLGVFIFVINGAMLLLVAKLMASFHLDGFLTAVLASAVVGLTGWLANSGAPARKRDKNRILVG